MRAVQRPQAGTQESGREPRVMPQCFPLDDPRRSSNPAPPRQDRSVPLTLGPSITFAPANNRRVALNGRTTPAGPAITPRALRLRRGLQPFTSACRHIGWRCPIAIEA